MDDLMNSWFSEQGLDDSIMMDQCDFINEEFAAILRDDFPDTIFSSSGSLIDVPTEPLQPRPKQRKSGLDRVPSIPVVLNFGSPENPGQVNSRGLNNSEKEAAVSDSGFMAPGSEPRKRVSRVRAASQAYDHIAAERKRRELLSQRFATLSAMVPGLTKMDKTSVLKDAIKYLNHLQERVKTLEEQATKQTMESLVLVKKSHQIMDPDNGFSDENNECSEEQTLPEIEARLCNNHILFRIQCEKMKGVVVKLLGLVEKLDLSVVSTNVLPFGNLALDITIIAEMEKESSVVLKDIVKVLHSALQRIG